MRRFSGTGSDVSDEEVERDTLDYDVLIVGGGPAVCDWGFDNVGGRW